MMKVYIPQASSLGLFNDAGPRVVAFAFNNMYGERVCVVPFLVDTTLGMHISLDRWCFFLA
jgi:hypothetical protein